MSAIDRVSEMLAGLAAALFVAAGLILAYEVGARYLFTAPTIWAEETARLFLVWGTFGGAAWLVRRRTHIRITLLTDRAPPKLRLVLELVSLAVIVAFALGIAVYGTEIAWNSFARGRTSGSMLDLPRAWSQAAVPAGALLVALQAVCEAIRTARGWSTPPSDREGTL